LFCDVAGAVVVATPSSPPPPRPRRRRVPATRPTRGSSSTSETRVDLTLIGDLPVATFERMIDDAKRLASTCAAAPAAAADDGNDDMKRSLL
jgi:hypothetical protein